MFLLCLGSFLFLGGALGGVVQTAEHLSLAIATEVPFFLLK